MVQIMEMSDDEKLKMYLKCSKQELAKMLIECNKIIHSRACEVKYDLQFQPAFCHHEWVLDRNSPQTVPTSVCRKCGIQYDFAHCYTYKSYPNYTTGGQ